MTFTQKKISLPNNYPSINNVIKKDNYDSYLNLTQYIEFQIKETNKSIKKVTEEANDKIKMARKQFILEASDQFEHNLEKIAGEWQLIINMIEPLIVSLTCEALKKINATAEIQQKIDSVVQCLINEVPKTPLTANISISPAIDSSKTQSNFSNFQFSTDVTLPAQSAYVTYEYKTWKSDFDLAIFELCNRILLASKTHQHSSAEL